jgi:hypothetical protein
MNFVKNVLYFIAIFFLGFGIMAIFDVVSTVDNVRQKPETVDNVRQKPETVDNVRQKPEPAISVSEYDPAHNPETWTSPLQGGQEFFNINSKVAGNSGSRLSLVIQGRSCSDVRAVWGYGLITNKEIFEINGTNVTVKQSGISILDMPFLEADTAAGTRYVLEQVLEEKPLVVKTNGVRLATDETVITTDGKRAYETIVGFCAQRKAAQERAL